MTHTVKLTPRERQVLELMCEGYCRKRIASELGTSVVTISTQQQAIFAAIGARTALQAVVKAFRSGVVPIELTTANTKGA